MNQQLSLVMLPQLGYRPEQFIVHAGVKDIIPAFQIALKTPDFRSLIIEAPARSGKTHLAVYLADLALQTDRPVLLLGNDEFQRCLERPAPEGVKPGQVCIVDDADRYLSQIQPGESGPFVSFFEALRWSNATLVFLTRERYQLPCDQHITSRLSLASWMMLNQPQREELKTLVIRMAMQRGIKLSDRKLSYLERRISPSIPAIEAYLEKVVHLSTVLGRKVGFELLSDAL